MTDLAIVPSSDDNERKLGDRPHDIPAFEGEEVFATKAKITSVGGLEIGDRVFRLDESVKLIIEARVVGIDHKPNAQGKLERHHLLKAIDSLVIAWDMDMDSLRDALSQ
jgi:hypothetical protein